MRQGREIADAREVSVKIASISDLQIDRPPHRKDRQTDKVHRDGRDEERDDARDNGRVVQRKPSFSNLNQMYSV